MPAQLQPGSFRLGLAEGLVECLAVLGVRYLGGTNISHLGNKKKYLQIFKYTLGILGWGYVSLQESKVNEAPNVSLHSSNQPAPEFLNNWRLVGVAP